MGSLEIGATAGGDGPTVAIAGMSGRIGRYMVLRELGAGAMGVVYAAYDPDLERKVAIKVLRAGLRDGSTGAVRMRREAQAMAKLSHPNVAQVYEVGEHGGRLFMAMEYLDGVTVRTWLESQTRTWREVVEVYTDAGRGLAAAHDAGLVHRDFKPDNVMVRADGRVCVLDFGLSRAHATGSVPTLPGSDEDDPQVSREGALIGTPAYMSPEQLLHREADARSDQFGFCVALYEGLFGQRPFHAESLGALTVAVTSGRHTRVPRGHDVPVWVQRVLDRGLMRDPAGRWPDMHALLEALARDPARRRRRWIATGLGIAGLVGIGYGVAVQRLGAAEVCGGAAEELRGVWDDERRATISSALRATGVAYADGAATSVRVHLDRYAESWVAAHTRGCEAHRRGHLSAQAFDRRMVCLRERRADLAATIEVLAQTTRTTIAQAADAASGLPALARCEDDTTLADASAPSPAQAAEVELAGARLARLRALDRGGRTTEALAESRTLLATAEKLDYAPLLAEVLVLTGKWQAQLAQATEARATLTRALHLGLEHRQDAVAAEALAHRIFVVSSVERRPADALLEEGLAWAIMRRAGSPPELAAALHNTLGATYDELGDPARSIAEYEQGLALMAEHAPDHPRRWALVSNLATSLNASDQVDRAELLAREGLARVAALSDPCHPHASVLRMLVASIEHDRGSFKSAAEGLEEALRCLGADYPAYSIEGLATLADTHRLAGDRAQTRAVLARADELLRTAPESEGGGPLIDLVRADLAIDEGDDGEAWRVLMDGYPRAIAAYGEEHYLMVPLMTRLAWLELRAGGVTGAQARLDAATRLLRPALTPRERGLLAEVTARVLRARGVPETLVAERVDEAVRAYASAGSVYAPQVAALRAWQASAPR